MADPEFRVLWERLSATMRVAESRLGDLEDEQTLKVAQSIGDAAQREAPVRSGRLRASERVRRLGTAGAIVYFDVIYSGPIHWGWRARGIEPNPFLTRAAEQTEDDLELERQAQAILNGVTGG